MLCDFLVSFKLYLFSGVFSCCDVFAWLCPMLPLCVLVCLRRAQVFLCTYVTVNKAYWTCVLPFHPTAQEEEDKKYILL